MVNSFTNCEFSVRCKEFVGFLLNNCFVFWFCLKFNSWCAYERYAAGCNATRGAFLSLSLARTARHAVIGAYRTVIGAYRTLPSKFLHFSCFLCRLDPDLTNKMSNTLLLCGGNSNLTGLESRLKNDLASNLNGITPRLKRTSSGNDSAWLGGSLFSKQPDFINACITEDIYFEHGAQVVHRLCL